MPETIYVGTESGVRVVTRKADGSWDVGAASLSSFSVETIEFSRSAPETVFAGTRGDGVWRSDDAGRSWRKPSYGRLGPGKVRALTLDTRSSGDRLWAGGEPIQLFASEDHASTWSVVESLQNEPWVADVSYPAPTVEPHVRDIVIDRADELTVYVALQVGYILKSTDGGSSWTLLRNNIDCDVHQVAIDARDSKRILAATGGQDVEAGLLQGRALYESSDAGGSWTPLAMEFDQDYALTVVGCPSDPTIWLSGVAKGHPGHWRGRASGADALLLRSVDRGASWTSVDVSDLSDGGRHLAIAFSFHPGAPGYVYAALSNGRLLASDDAGQSWVSTNLEFPGLKDIRCVRV